MTETPKVSVLIPTYNYARFLPFAIDSVLAQDFGDFEVLISDDASSDGSADLIRRYAALDPRIRFHLQEKNLGLVGNWNWCLREARGECVKFLFADDCFTFSNSLGRLLSHLENNPGVALAAAARLIIDEKSCPVAIWNHWGGTRSSPGHEAIARCLRYDANLIGEPSAVIFRRSADHRGFDPCLRQLVDLEFWFHLLMHGNLVFDPEPLCSFRVHAAQQTKKNLQPHLGPAESLCITGRYLDLACKGAGGGLTAFQEKKILHRCLHYSRKRVPQTREIVAAESALDARLPRPWWFVCWAQHRITKPFNNLGQFWKRHISHTEQRHSLPAYLRAWEPPKARHPAV